jgi:hypothetical protein
MPRRRRRRRPSNGSSTPHRSAENAMARPTAEAPIEPPSSHRRNTVGANAARASLVWSIGLVRTNAVAVVAASAATSKSTRPAVQSRATLRPSVGSSTSHAAPRERTCVASDRRERPIPRDRHHQRGDEQPLRGVRAKRGLRERPPPRRPSRLRRRPFGPRRSKEIPPSRFGRPRLRACSAVLRWKDEFQGRSSPDLP